MFRKSSTPRVGLKFTVLAVVIAATLAWPCSSVSNAEPAAESLTLAPRDAAFYSSMLRNGEQYDAVVNSNFWKQLNEWKLWQDVLDGMKTDLQGSGVQWQRILQMLDQPENQQALQVVKEMVSTEMFCYGDARVVGSLSLAVEALVTTRIGPLLYEVAGQETDLNQEEFVQKMVLESLAKDLDNVAVPGLVFGFKIENVEAANQQLARLEVYLREALEESPDMAPYRDGFQREKIGDSDFLTLKVTGEMLPLDEMPFEELEDEEGQFDGLREKLEQLTIVVSLGIRGDYLILAISDSTEIVANLGKGEALADHEHLAPLKAAGEHRYTHVSYVSEEIRSAFATSPEELEAMVDTAKSILPAADDLSEEMREKIQADAEQLVADLRPYITQQGAQLTYSYLNDRGIESKAYDWSENKTLDGSKTLTMLEHLGDKPVLAVLVCAQHRPGDYAVVVKWLGKLRGYVEEFVVPLLSSREQEMYDEIVGIAIPLLGKFDEINRTMLIPSLADGQCGLVIDGNEKTTMWSKFLPETTEEVALPAPALLLGVSDAERFDRALAAYRIVLNDALAELHKANPEEVPKYEIPPARSRKIENGGKIYYYRPKLGIHNQVAPSIALSKNIAVLSSVPRQARTLAESKPLTDKQGPLADVARPLAAATYFDWHAMVEMAVPWLNELARADDQFSRQDSRRRGGRIQDDGMDTPEDLITTLDGIKKGGQLIRVFRGYTSVTYVEDNALVTHSETVFKDLE